MYRETRIRHTSSDCPDCGSQPDADSGHAHHSQNAEENGSNGGHSLVRCYSEASSYSRQNGGNHGHKDQYCGKRKYSMVKFGYHRSIPLARSTPSAESSDAMPTVDQESISTPHVIALVGLPARGKTYISKKLSRYLNWIGINTKVFNLGEYRRKVLPKYENANFFDPSNDEGQKLREQVCVEAINDVIQWFNNEDGEVAVFDATNTTRKRRELLYKEFVERHECNLFFVESICDKEDIIDNNIKEVKVTSPDYKAVDTETAVVNDFKERIKHYADQYEPLDDKLEPKYSFLTIFNAGEKVLVHKHEGHIQSRIVYYLMNVHITKRTIYLTRHGETHFNAAGLVGGDCDLTDRGRRYAKMLAKYVENLPDKDKLKVWTSWMKRTIQTTKQIPGVQERWKALNEIDIGQCDGMTYAEIASKFPAEFVARDNDKFSFRYPRGESYEDLVARLEPVIMELERQDSVLVVAHQAVIRCLLGYYLETPEDEMPWLEVPLHTVIKLEPIAYGCKVQYIKFPVDCVSTHRERPEKPGQLQERYKKGQMLEDNREMFDLDDSFLSKLQVTDKPASQLKEVEIKTCAKCR